MVCPIFFLTVSEAWASLLVRLSQSKENAPHPDSECISHVSQRQEGMASCFMISTFRLQCHPSTKSHLTDTCLGLDVWRRHLRNFLLRWASDDQRRVYPVRRSCYMHTCSDHHSHSKSDLEVGWYIAYTLQRSVGRQDGKSITGGTIWTSQKST